MLLSPIAQRLSRSAIVSLYIHRKEWRILHSSSLPPSSPPPPPPHARKHSLEKVSVRHIWDQGLPCRGARSEGLITGRELLVAIARGHYESSSGAEATSDSIPGIRAYTRQLLKLVSMVTVHVRDPQLAS